MRVWGVKLGQRLDLTPLEVFSNLHDSMIQGKTAVLKGFFPELGVHLASDQPAAIHFFPQPNQVPSQGCAKALEFMFIHEGKSFSAAS